MAKPIGPGEAERGRAIAEWRAMYPEAWGFELEWDDEVGVPVPVTRRISTTRCGATLRSGEMCQQWAGIRTAHRGVGRCWRHDTRVERAAGAWMVAHRIAQVLEISPWEALLLAVKRAAAWASFYDAKLEEVENDDDLRPGGAAYVWVEAAERVNDKLARWSKMAVDAGVARMLVEQAQTEGAQIARVLNAAIAGASLDEETELRLRTALRRALEELATPAIASPSAETSEADDDTINS